MVFQLDKMSNEQLLNLLETQAKLLRAHIELSKTTQFMITALDEVPMGDRSPEFYFHIAVQDAQDHTYLATKAMRKALNLVNR